MVCHHRTRTCVRLLGPCFKTGCREPFSKPSHPPEPLPDKSDGFLRNMKRLGRLRPQGGGPREPPKDDQSTHWLPTVPSQQFQALFNSLFKVLFIFPSQYLFAIGLPPVFSLRWNLPPALSYNPKQLDSVTRPAMGNSERRTGLSPSLMPCSKGLTPGSPKGTHVTTPEGFTTWALPASVALTEGILVSFFSSA